MKKNRQRIILLVGFLVFLFTMAACGGNSDEKQEAKKNAPFEGSWKLLKVNEKKYDGERVYTFSDGKVEVKSNGEKQFDFKYRFIKDNVIAISGVPFEQTEPFVSYYQFDVEIKGSRMTFTYNSSSGSSGRRIMIFERVE